MPATTQVVSQHDPYSDSYYYVQNASGSASQATPAATLIQPPPYSPQPEPYGQKH